MKRRGFLAAMFGLAAAPLLAKVKEPVRYLFGFKVKEEIGMTVYNPDAIKRLDFVRPTERELLDNRIKKEMDKHYLLTGVYPNNLFLGKQEYDLWIEGHSEVWGKGPVFIKDWDGLCYYVTAYNMIVYVKVTPGDWPGDARVEETHLSVDYCQDNADSGLVEHVMKSKGFLEKG